MERRPARLPVSPKRRRLTGVGAARRRRRASLAAITVAVGPDGQFRLRLCQLDQLVQGLRFPSMHVDVTVALETDGLLGVKLQTPAWEVNVRASPAEIASLRDIRGADWDTQRTIAAGRSAGESAFWAYEDCEVTLMIGHDEETWDIGVTIPVETVDELVSQAEREV
jgi:hypothetical protein